MPADQDPTHPIGNPVPIPRIPDRIPAGCYAPLSCASPIPARMATVSSGAV